MLSRQLAGIQVRDSEKQAGCGVSIWNLEAMGLGEATKRDGVDTEGRRDCTEHGHRLIFQQHHPQSRSLPLKRLLF